MWAKKHQANLDLSSLNYIFLIGIFFLAEIYLLFVMKIGLGCFFLTCIHVPSYSYVIYFLLLCIIFLTRTVCIYFLAFIPCFIKKTLKIFYSIGGLLRMRSFFLRKKQSISSPARIELEEPLAGSLVTIGVCDFLEDRLFVQ